MSLAALAADEDRATAHARQGRPRERSRLGPPWHRGFFRGVRACAAPPDVHAGTARLLRACKSSYGLRWSAGEVRSDAMSGSGDSCVRTILRKQGIPDRNGGHGWRSMAGEWGGRARPAARGQGQEVLRLARNRKRECNVARTRGPGDDRPTACCSRRVRSGLQSCVVPHNLARLDPIKWPIELIFALARHTSRLILPPINGHGIERR
jgi:hypothetical protein